MSETITFVDSDSSGRSTKRRPAPSFCLRRPATSTVRCCECVGQQHQDGQLADNFLLFPHDPVRPRDECRIDGGLQHGDEAEQAQFPRKQHFAQQHMDGSIRRWELAVRRAASAAIGRRLKRRVIIFASSGSAPLLPDSNNDGSEFCRESSTSGSYSLEATPCASVSPIVAFPPPIEPPQAPALCDFLAGQHGSVRLGRFRLKNPVFLFNVKCERQPKYSSIVCLPTSAVNPENGMVIPVDDDDVARERELIQNKPVTVLQKDNNLVIK